MPIIEYVDPFYGSIVLNDLKDLDTARLNGDRFYFNGKPCSLKNHLVPRITASTCCIECSKAQSRRSTRRRRLDVAKNLFMSRRFHCRHVGKDFKVTLDHIREILPEDMLCPILLVKMDPDVPSLRPSMDKIDPTKGYINGNICIMSMKANLIKSNITDPEVFRRLADLLEGTSR